MRKLAFTFLSMALFIFIATAFNHQSWKPKSVKVADQISATKKGASPEILLWENTKHDFGTIRQGIPVNYLFEFTNNGDVPVILTKVKPSCGCTATDYPKEPIAPGESATIKATYNAKSIGRFNKSIVVNTDVPHAEGVLYISGEVVQ